MLNKSQIKSLTCLSAIVASVGLSMPYSYAASRVSIHTFETEVKEVRASNVDGQHRLLLEIDSVTGPTGCKSSSVILASGHLNQNIQSEIETAALQAFLTSESVVVSVPIELGHCIDGKPLVTGLKLLNFPTPILEAPY